MTKLDHICPAAILHWGKDTRIKRNSTGRQSQALEEENLQPVVLDMIDDLVDDLIEAHTDEEAPPEDWDLRGLEEAFLNQFSVTLN